MPTPTIANIKSHSPYYQQTIIQLREFVAEQLSKWHSENEKLALANPKNTTLPKTSQLLLYLDEPLSKKQIVEISQSLTEYFTFPIYVLPASNTFTENFQIGEYCNIIFKVTSELDVSQVSFELMKCYQMFDEGAGLHKYQIVFVGDNAPFRWQTKNESNLLISRKVYLCNSGKNSFLALVEKDLVVGAEYEGKGLIFDMKKLNEFRVSLGVRQVACLFDEVKETRKAEPTQTTLDKCKGKPFEWFIDSIMYPYHHCIRPFGELMTYNMFHLDTKFPMNLLLIGEPNTGKTAIANKISKIAGDEMLTGAGTIKGLVPSFNSQNMNAGLLGTARYKAVVNEFFTYLSSAAAQDKSEFLSKLKDTLEGVQVTFASGNGKMQIKQVADFIGVANPPKRQGEGWASNVIELYSIIDGAFLDRILFYWVPHEQKLLVDEWKTWVKIQENSVGGRENIHTLANEAYLTPAEQATLLSFCKKATYSIENEECLDKCSKELTAHCPLDKMSRSFEFMLNIATAHAVIRSLSDGIFAQHITIKNEDIQNAKEFMIAMVTAYSHTDTPSGTRGIMLSSLTAVESAIFSKLENASRAENKHAKSIPIAELALYATDKEELFKILLRLAKKRLIAFNTEKAIWLDSLSPESWKIIENTVNGQPLPEQNSENGKIVGWLMNQGILDHLNDGVPYLPWKSFWELDFAQQALKIPAETPTSTTVQNTNNLQVEVIRYSKSQPRKADEGWTKQLQNSEDLMEFLRYNYDFNDTNTWKTTEMIIKHGFKEEELSKLSTIGMIRQPTYPYWIPAVPQQKDI